MLHHTSLAQVQLMLPLNDFQLVLVDILRANGGWMTPDEIARVLGNDHLSQYALRTLDWLEDMEFVNKEYADGDARYHHGESTTEREQGRV
jgi:hypothetical protein